MEKNSFQFNVALATTLLLLFAAVPQLHAQQQDWSIYDWETNLEQAAVQAEQENKQILVFFAGSDWCGWCDRLIVEVIETDRFQTFLDSYVVPVLIDFPRNIPISPERQEYNQELARRFAVSGYPTVFILDSSEAMRLRTGYRQGGADSYITHLLPAVR
ncbi:MAG: thioredoxin family protein [Spirochaetia bacterium]